ncbi:immunoglobulin kappa light chain-like [Thunnus thynnus]|uniref:immunoglobulin kappa light chain-like n=1 Tax=Thunnus thynnus TaxID=8237 RepID=UPI003528E488
MLFGFYILLMLRVGRCADNQIFVTKTVGVGDNVTLTCIRQRAESETTTLFWIRLVSGNVPEFLGGTLAFDYDGVDKTSRITAKQEPGTFVLHIDKTKLSDTGLYYCIKVNQRHLTFLNGTFLRIEGPEPDITAITQDFPSDPVHPGDSVTLQCSVLSDSENKKCPEEHRVYWFRAGSDESHPSFIYAHGNSGDECEKSPETRSPQKCVYSFSKEVSSSDAETYYCAVATCGEILFGNGTKLNTEASVVSRWDLQKANTIIYLLCAALAISLVVTAFLIYCIKKKSCDCCNAAVALQTNAETASGGWQSQQRYQDSLVYSAPTFTKKKAGKAGRRNAKAAEENCVYTTVRV